LEDSNIVAFKNKNITNVMETSLEKGNGDVAGTVTLVANKEKTI